MSKNTSRLNSEIINNKKSVKLSSMKPETKKKKTKNNFYNSSFKLGIPEHSSEEEDDSLTAIKIFYKEKIATINMNISEPFSALIEQIKRKFKIEKFEEKFEIFYDRKEIPLTDARTISEIIGNQEEDEYPIFELREKFIKNLDIKDKLYIELENVPSFMDLTSQISDFIEKQEKEVDYELNYRNNVYVLLFCSNEIGFSFITFMNNLKFSNKYYRKLKIKIHFKTVDKIRYELENKNAKVEIDNLTTLPDTYLHYVGIFHMNKIKFILHEKVEKISKSWIYEGKIIEIEFINYFLKGEFFKKGMLL